MEGPLITADKRERILSSIPFLSGFPTLSTLSIKACSLLRNPQKEHDEIIQFLYCTPILALQIIKEAGFQETSLSMAIDQLGRDKCIEVIQRYGLLNAMPNQKEGYSIANLWKNSLMTAVNCEIIYDLLKDRNDFTFSAEEIKLAGLFHNLGVLILEQFTPQYTREAVQYAIEHKCSLHDAEEKVLGIDHAEVAAQLLQNWNFAEIFIETIRYHENPESSPEHFRTACRLIHIASHLHDIPEVSPLHKFHESFDERAWEGLNMNFKDLGKITLMARQKYNKIERHLPPIH